MTDELDSTGYRKITVSDGDRHYTVYCTAENLATRFSQVKAWVDRLTRRLGWEGARVVIKNASESEANERPGALFEQRPR